MTRQRDTAPATGISPWRLALVVPGVLLVERALTDWLPRAGVALSSASPAVQIAVGVALCVGLAVGWYAVLRREVSRG